MNWNKLICDTLKTPNGKWSRKSLTMFVSFSITIWLGAYIVFSDRVLEREINRYAIDVFYGFMALTMAMAGVAEIGKKFANKIGSTKDESNNQFNE